ncbi:hypothetical protein COV16_03830 [Candidatus Woesearchaeota archaeon CG10_big_fil_rev_8_21_14_0_10_34_8]|nr:MAG: hypothetical protein COV16_03830 [Candidatus Woesearchaeota archaeon CG10_big_fil_rev_8_21_14_0_10_34_8]
MYDKQHICFETLANELRTDILSKLKNKPLSVNELTAVLNVERTRVSHSLSMLRNCNFIKMEKHGKKRVYSLNLESNIFNKSNKDIFTIMNEHKKHICTGKCHKIGD